MKAPPKAKSTTAPTKKAQSIKSPAPLTKWAIKQSKLWITKSSDFFTAIRPRAFVNDVGSDKDFNVQSYTTAEINLHNSKFHKQLKFHFAATRQKNVIASRQ
mmetsp:Transcript_430/g.958  ORF Transcript_430/g.958 Transcript_430/m.958 type:complete len:102 (+) Transcript_430:331-636(+)